MNKLKKKTLLLTLTLSAGLLLPMGASAQKGGGIFYRGDKAENVDNVSLMNRGNFDNNGLSLQGFGENQDGLSLQNFGENAPLGSGWLVLMTAGVGYAAMKTRKNKKQTKSVK